MDSNSNDISNNTTTEIPENVNFMQITSKDVKSMDNSMHLDEDSKLNTKDKKNICVQR